MSPEWAAARSFWNLWHTVNQTKPSRCRPLIHSRQPVVPNRTGYRFQSARFFIQRKCFAIPFGYPPMRSRSITGRGPLQRFRAKKNPGQLYSQPGDDADI